MARDYSSRRNSSPSNKKRKPGRPKPAARPVRAQRARGAGGPPGWIWLLCGLCIGLTVAAGFYVFGRPAGVGGRDTVSVNLPNGAPRDDASSSNAASNSGQGAQHGDGAASQKKPRFSFYKMLPNYEVVIPQEEYPNRGNSHGTPSPAPSQQADTRRSTAASSPEPTTPTVEEPGSYVIQAGSFSTYKDADRRKAELALLGITSRIVDIDLSSGKTVYRVQSETINASDKLNSTLKRLRDNRIDVLVMKAKN